MISNSNIELLTLLKSMFAYHEMPKRPKKHHLKNYGKKICYAFIWRVWYIIFLLLNLHIITNFLIVENIRMSWRKILLQILWELISSQKVEKDFWKLRTFSSSVQNISPALIQCSSAESVILYGDLICDTATFGDGEVIKKSSLETACLFIIYLNVEPECLVLLHDH